MEKGYIAPDQLDSRPMRPEGGCRGRAIVTLFLLGAVAMGGVFAYDYHQDQLKARDLERRQQEILEARRQRALAEREEADLARRGASRARREAPSEAPETADAEAIDRLIDRMRSSDEIVRAEAAARLVQIGVPAIEPLMAELDAEEKGPRDPEWRDLLLDVLEEIVERNEPKSGGGP